MVTFIVIKFKVSSQFIPQFLRAVEFVDIDTFIFDTSPQALHKDVVQGSSATIPTDTDICHLESLGELSTRKLHTLVRVKNLRCRSLQGAI